MPSPAGAVESGGRPAVPLSVLGPRGVLDLLVPAEADVGEVAAAYATTTGHPGPVLVTTTLGRTVDTGPVGDRVRPGTVLVAHPESNVEGPTPRSPPSDRCAEQAPSRRLVAPGVGLMLLATAATPRLGSDGEQMLVAVTLLVGALVCLGPAGRSAPRRVAVAPALGAAAAYVVRWEPDGNAHPALWAAAALGLAAAGGLGSLVRAVRSRSDEDTAEVALGTWATVGSVLATLLTVAAVVQAPDRAVWSGLLLGALLTVYAAPRLVVRVPDGMLLDPEYAVLAPAGSPLRTPPVDPVVVQRLADRGRRRLTVVATAAAVVAAGASLLVRPGTGSREEVASALLVALVASGLALSARGQRSAAVRNRLRAGGLGCVLALVWTLAQELPPGPATLVGAVAALGSAACVGGAVASGRGWRSVGLARAVEGVEGSCLALAVPSAVVAAGAVPLVWRLVGG